MISFTVEGVEDAVSAIGAVPASLARESVFGEVAQTFSFRLRAATPVGYSRRLRDSVIYTSDESGAEVGYESGVETSGDPELDGIIQINANSRSVLNRKRQVWTPAEELGSILEETFTGFTSDAMSVMQARFSDGLS